MYDVIIWGAAFIFVTSVIILVIILILLALTLILDFGKFLKDYFG